MIAGVLKRQVGEAASIGADQVVATDDESAMDSLPLLDAVADTVDGKTAEKLISKVKPGGVFASVLGPPQNAEKYPSVKVVPFYSTVECESPPVHGRCRQRWQTAHPHKPEVSTERRGRGSSCGRKGRQR